MKVFTYLVILGIVVGCASISDYTPTIAPSSRLDQPGLYIDGTPARDDSSLNSTQLSHLNLYRAANSFAIIFESKGNPTRLYVNGASQNWHYEDIYKVYDIPRNICLSSINYQITAKDLSGTISVNGERSVRSGIYVERGTMVEHVAPGANNTRPLVLDNIHPTALVRHYFYDTENVAKLAIRSVQDNPNLNVQVKLPSDSTWQSVLAPNQGGWVEFALGCGGYFELKAQRLHVPDSLSITETLEIAVVGNDGVYGQGFILDVMSYGNPG